MTVVVAWKRRLKQGAEELCFASDSRLSGGGTIDCAQKVFTLKRGDAAIAFAGETAIAYPYILQVINSLEGFRASRTRAMDIIEIRSHVIRMLNQIVDDIDTDIDSEKLPNVRFILGGFSWIEKKFHLWYIQYNKDLKKFHYDKAKSFGHSEECIAFVGDRGDDLKAKFYDEMRQNYGPSFGDLKLDMEPLKCLIDFLKSSTDRWSTIGFPPQFAKVYQHMNALYIPLADDKGIYYCGRKLFEYEHIDEWPLSLNTFERVNPNMVK